MSRRIVMLALVVLACGWGGKSADGQFFGTGYGYGYGSGYGGFGGGIATYPYAGMSFFAPGPGPGFYNPLFSVGLSPLAVQSAIGEVTLGGRAQGQMVTVPGASSKIPITGGTSVTITSPGQRTYTYRIITP